MQSWAGRFRRNTRRCLARLSLGAVVLLAAGSVAAQDATTDLAGHRVRLDLSGIRAPTVGRVVSAGDESLILRVETSGEQTEVGWADVERLEVSRGKKGNTLKGLVGGAAAWGILVGAIAAFGTLDESGVAEPLVIGGFLAGGALAGSKIKTEKWQRLSVPRVADRTPGRERGIQLRVAVRF